jgi:hypothetical protein
MMLPILNWARNRTMDATAAGANQQQKTAHGQQRKKKRRVVVLTCPVPDYLVIAQDVPGGDPLKKVFEPPTNIEIRNNLTYKWYRNTTAPTTQGSGQNPLTAGRGVEGLNRKLAVMDLAALAGSFPFPRVDRYHYQCSFSKRKPETLTSGNASTPSSASLNGSGSPPTAAPVPPQKSTPPASVSPLTSAKEDAYVYTWKVDKFGCFDVSNFIFMQYLLNVVHSQLQTEE